MPEKDEHYLEAVTELGNSEKIAASKDIYSESGLLLLSKGSRINSKVFNVLTKHNLRGEVDGSLSIGDAITNAQLIHELQQELNRFPAFKQMVQAIPNPLKLEAYLRHIYLNDVMRNKLTVAYKSFPSLFAHSLRVAIGSAIAGMFCGLADEQCEHLAAAGLFHDLGDMHLDPMLFDPERTLVPKEKRAIYTHPLVMFNLLKQSEAYHPHISVPVLEHHERLNGSGYPQRTQGYSNKLSAVLAVVEVLVSMRERYSSRRVMMVLTGQAGLYDREVIQAVFKGMRFSPREEEGETSSGAFDSQGNLTMLQQIISQWSEVQSGLDLENLTDLQKQVVNRVQDIQQMLIRGGIALSDPDALALFAGDNRAMMEACHLLSEARYSARELYLEVARKFEHKEVEASGKLIAGWIDQLGKQVYDVEGGLAQPKD